MKGKRVPFVLLVILIIALPLLLIGIKQTLDNRTHAAAADKLEVEGGNLSGNAVNKSDSSASNNSYIELGMNQVNSPTPTLAQTGNIFPQDTSGITKFIQPSQAEPALGATVTNLGTSWGLQSPAGDTKTKHVANDRHHYSKTPVWNIDQTLIRLNSGALLDGTTYASKGKAICSNPCAWSSVNPRYAYTSSANGLVRWDVQNTASPNPVSSTLATYSTLGSTSVSNVEYSKNYELNIALDDTMAFLANSSTIPFVINGSDGSVRCYVSSPPSGIDNVSVSWDGNYLIVQDSRGLDTYSVPRPGSASTPCPFLRTLTGSLSGAHADTAVSAAGDQVVVDESIYMWKLSDGTRTTIYSTDIHSLHVSGRNIKRPGWIYVGSDGSATCDTYQQGSKLYRRIVAFKLDTSGTFENFAWSHDQCGSVSVDSYSAAAMPVPSPDGKRVWFKGTWDGTTGLHSYVSGMNP